MQMKENYDTGSELFNGTYDHVDEKQQLRTVVVEMEQNCNIKTEPLDTHLEVEEKELDTVTMEVQGNCDRKCTAFQVEDNQEELKTADMEMQRNCDIETETQLEEAQRELLGGGVTELQSNYDVKCEVFQRMVVMEVPGNCDVKSDSVADTNVDMGEKQREDISAVVMEIPNDVKRKVTQRRPEEADPVDGDELLMLEAYQAESELQQNTKPVILETDPLERPVGELPVFNFHPMIDSAETLHQFIPPQKAFPGPQKSFPREQAFQHITHYMNHAGEKPYKCTQCEKSFKTKNAFRTHLLKHTGERPYQCEQCGKRFRCRGVRRHHMQRMHTVEKRFKCTECEQAFAMNSRLSTSFSHTHRRNSFSMR